MRFSWARRKNSSAPCGPIKILVSRVSWVWSRICCHCQRSLSVEDRSAVHCKSMNSIKRLETSLNITHLVSATDVGWKRGKLFLPFELVLKYLNFNFISLFASGWCAVGVPNMLSFSLSKHDEARCERRARDFLRICCRKDVKDFFLFLLASPPSFTAALSGVNRWIWDASFLFRRWRFEVNEFASFFGDDYMHISFPQESSLR